MGSEKQRSSILIRRGCAAYPRRLCELHDPPSTLYVLGEPAAELDAPMVAVVGARVCTGYGRQVARRLSASLAAAGFVVVSGLARGIDSAAHRGALEAGGSTIAVLGSAVDRVYPRSNVALAREIRERGLLVSEYPSGTPAAPFRFPQRNRIIAGLARATVIVEAAAGSGAMITADFALEAGRDVFAVPGEITCRQAEGTNRLIHQGAIPVVSADELLADLGVEPTRSASHRPAASQLSVEHVEVLDAIAAGARTLDELGRRLDRDQGALAASITALELAGVVQEENGIFRPSL